MNITNAENQFRSLQPGQEQTEIRRPPRTAGSERLERGGTGAAGGGPFITDVVEVSETGRELLSAVSPEEAIGITSIERPDLPNLVEGDSVFDKLKVFSRDPAGGLELLTHREIGIGAGRPGRAPKPVEQVQHLDVLL